MDGLGSVALVGQRAGQAVAALLGLHETDYTAAVVEVFEILAQTSVLAVVFNYLLRCGIDQGMWGTNETKGKETERKVKDEIKNTQLVTNQAETRGKGRNTVRNQNIFNYLKLEQ